MRSEKFLFVLFCGFFGAIDCKKNDEYIVNYVDRHSYKLVYVSQPWNIAKELCAIERAKLAVPKNLEQFHFIQRMVRNMKFNQVFGTDQRELVWIGVSDLQGSWTNVDGESIYDTGFHSFATNNAPSQWSNSTNFDEREPHCAVIDAVNTGFREWWCQKPQPFICEKQPIL